MTGTARKWAPGPWRFEHDDHEGDVLAANGYQVSSFDLGGAFLYGGKAEWEREIVHGHLIAAAPAMYEALDEAINYLGVYAATMKDEKASACLSKCTAAMAQATGEGGD